MRIYNGILKYTEYFQGEKTRSVFIYVKNNRLKSRYDLIPLSCDFVRVTLCHVEEEFFYEYERGGDAICYHIFDRFVIDFNNRLIRVQ